MGYYELKYVDGRWVAYELHTGKSESPTLCSTDTRAECIFWAENMGYTWVGE